MVKGKLIVLNGGSSSGKTSVARAFQELVPECWMHLGIDVFWYGIPQSQLDLAQVRPEYYTWDVVEADGLPWLSLTPGPLLDKAMRARYLAIRAFLEEGINVVTDDLIWKRDWLVDFLRIFEGYQVWLVGIHVSDDEGTRRESERDLRVAGSNRGSARAAHTDAEYDFELDTTGIPVPTLARKLLDWFRSCPHPEAFDRLRKRPLA